jgi:hypothetical protein
MKTEKVIAKINLDKELSKRIANISHYSIDNFISDSMRYIKGIKEGRTICSIGSVSSVYHYFEKEDIRDYQIDKLDQLFGISY